MSNVRADAPLKIEVTTNIIVCIGHQQVGLCKEMAEDLYHQLGVVLNKHDASS